MEIQKENSSNINQKITTLTENLNILLETTINGSKIYIMNEKINFIKIIQTRYHSLIFEQELFDILLKNKYAIQNFVQTNDENDDNASNFTYYNTEYPFSLIICSKDACRSSILLNNAGITVVKFILYLRMLYQLVGRADSPNSLLAVNTKILPFGRICIDIDYKGNNGDDNNDDDDNDDMYENFIQKCFKIVCEYTTIGNIIMTVNCYTPNTRSFHLITEQQFDIITRKILFQKISQKILKLNSNVCIDQVHVWMLPFGRGHIPARKYNRKNNELLHLVYPFTEIDFELSMPFDLNLGIDNLYTLLNFSTLASNILSLDADTNTDDIDTMDNNYENDALYEYFNGEILHSYYLNCSNGVEQILQPYIRIVSFKYDFGLSTNINYRYEHNYIPRVLGHRYNNFLLIASNKKLLFESNWQIPKPKIKQRPTEFYEIYRFIKYKFNDDIVCLSNIFDKFPSDLVQKNVNIGTDDAAIDYSKNKTNRLAALNSDVKCNERNPQKGVFNWPTNNTVNSVRRRSERVYQANVNHPWPYVKSRRYELSQNASTSIIDIFEYYRKTIESNVYTYEKYNNRVMQLMRNIQIIYDSYDTLLDIINNVYLMIMHSDTQKNQTYMFPLYEFFCRIHYIDACLTTDEWNELKDDILLVETISINGRDDFIDNYRRQHIEMSPGKMAYKKFPSPNTELAKIWDMLTPDKKVILHIFYLMMVEHNYTSLFIYLHNISRINNTTNLVCCFLLTIIENSYITDDNDGTVQISYASREFINFLFCTLIDAGPAVHCDLIDGNVEFNLTKLDPVIADLQTMFVGSPIWFFLTNFQYMDENIDYVSRFEIYAQIFVSETQDIDDPDPNSSTIEAEPQAKKARLQATPSLIFYQILGKLKIVQLYCNDILEIFIKNILVFCNTENGRYIYSGDHFKMSSIKNILKINPHTIQDPAKHALLYRHQYGIYNTWTMQFERNTSVFYTQIVINIDEFAKSPELFNAYNSTLYKIVVNRYLKSIAFTRILHYQKNLALLLAPIYDPNIQNNSLESIAYTIDSIQINIHDLSSPDFILPEEMLYGILSEKNKLYDMFKWLYSIICHYSEYYSCQITIPGTFIPKCMVPETKKHTETIDSTYSMYQQQIEERQYTLESNNNKGEKLIQRIHEVMNSKTTEQQTNITDELQKLSRQELTSLIILFDSVAKCNDDNNVSEEFNTTNIHGQQNSDDSDNSHRDNITNSMETDELFKVNLSNQCNHTVAANLFYNNGEYMENDKNKLLLNLFNKNINSTLKQTSIESFRKTIEENFAQHTIKFVLLILSWFIRTTHTHIFSESKFFREIQQHRQILYNELVELSFKYNGYFIYNNVLTNVVDIFSIFCRHTKLVVDPIFNMSFNVDKHDLYLGYDASFEHAIPTQTITSIEFGCISAIYQGQFNEDTNVDLNRLWARVTIPRNKHRISPLFKLHTSTGKSEYLTERCRKHFKHKIYNNFLDSTSLKSGDSRGIDMARELNGNLIVCIEEFNNLSEKFKQICGHSAITYKPLWNDSKNSYQNNATVILSTNDDPKCTEAAVIARLHVYPRRIQYAPVNPYLKFARNSVVLTETKLSINNILAVQLIMEKMPRNLAENYKGNFMMTWLLKRFFLYNILDPVTVQASETLQQNIDNFHTMINAQQLVLDRLELNVGEMSLFQFRKIVNQICDENRTLFNTRVDTYNVFVKLKDTLHSMINFENNIIRVREKSIK